jgi:hypothetical protein
MHDDLEGAEESEARVLHSGLRLALGAVNWLSFRDCDALKITAAAD